jgi:hypothetical protein
MNIEVTLIYFFHEWVVLTELWVLNPISRHKGDSKPAEFQQTS